MRLNDLIDKYRTYQMTEQEETEQRRSFAYGNCVIENPNITRQMVTDADTPPDLSILWTTEDF